MKIGIVITRAASLDATWTTVHLAVEALDMGHEVRLIERPSFEVDPSGNLVCRAFAFDQPTNAAMLLASLHKRTARRCYVDARKLDLLLLRTAPLNPAMLSFALMVRDAGVPVVNDPAGILRVSHKAWLASIPGLATPPSLVTGSGGQAELFYSAQDAAVVVKPARGSGGRAVARVAPRSARAFDAAFRNASRAGDGWVVVQRFVRADDGGEKRLVWLDGQVIGGYQRQPAIGEFRHNLKQGGKAIACPVTDHERALIAALSPHLLAVGIRIAGIDLIGAHVIEVNALNPGGAFHADRLTGTRLARRIIESLTAHPNAPLTLENPPWAHPAP